MNKIMGKLNIKKNIETKEYEKLLLEMKAITKVKEFKKTIKSVEDIISSSRKALDYIPQATSSIGNCSVYRKILEVVKAGIGNIVIRVADNPSDPLFDFIVKNYELIELALDIMDNNNNNSFEDRTRMYNIFLSDFAKNMENK